MKITLLILALTLNVSIAGEHSWITAGMCTPPELWQRGIVGTENPALSRHDKLIVGLGESQLLLEIASVEESSIRFNWVLITPTKVSSGTESFKRSDGWAAAEFNEFKGLSYQCSFDSNKERVTLRLKMGTRYSLVAIDSHEGEQ